MDKSVKRSTAGVNGRLWGQRHQDWADIQEVQYRAAYEAVFDRVGLGAGHAYCDLGCGSGVAAALAAGRGAAVSGLDAAENALAIARERVPCGDFRVGDLEELPFEGGTFDVVTGFNSFQFAGSPVAALAEARRITRESGHVVMMTWGPPQGMQAASLVAALKPLLPPAPAGAPDPSALSDRSALAALAQRAGLRPVEVADIDCVWRYADLATALRGLGSAGVAVRAAQNTSRADVDCALTGALAPFAKPDGSYEVQAAFRWLLAAARA